MKEKSVHVGEINNWRRANAQKGGFGGFQVPATEVRILPLVKIGERLAICCYPHKIF